MSNITVDCAVCGKHSVSVPARVGIYRVKCYNNVELGYKYDYSATVIRVYDDGRVASKQGSPD